MTFYEAIKLDDLVKSHQSGWPSKKLQMQGAQIQRSEAYLGCTPQRRRMPGNAADGLFTKPSSLPRSSNQGYAGTVHHHRQRRRDKTGAEQGPGAAPNEVVERPLGQGGLLLLPPPVFTPGLDNGPYCPDEPGGENHQGKCGAGLQGMQ